MTNFIITIDGPAGSGKSTVAKLLAKTLGVSFLDTGAMYRAVTLAAMRAGADMNNEDKLLEIIQTHSFKFTAHKDGMAAFVDGMDVTEQIRRPEVTANVRHIASKAALRAELVNMQRQFAAGRKQIITEGRDQGTVAFEDADLKFYLTADLRERARRRRAELQAKGDTQGLEQIEEAIEHRDKSDEDRAVGPLKPAHDAIVIDTTNLSLEDVVEKVLRCVREKCLRSKDRRQKTEDRRQKVRPPSSVLRPPAVLCRLPSGLRPAWYWLARWACRLFCILFFRFRSFGRENVPVEGPFILASNHQSFLDPVFCGVPLRRQLLFMARESLFSNKFFGVLIRSVDAIPVKRDQADIASIRQVIARLNQGRGICLFPEATRTSDGRIQQLKPGLGLLCRRSQAAIVPVLIDGAFECWPRHKKIFSSGTINVCFGKLIEYEQIRNMNDEMLASVLTDKLRQMQKQCRLRQGKQPYNYL